VKRELVETVPHGKIYSFPQADYIAFIFSTDYVNNKGIRELVRVIKEKEKWLIFSDLQLEGDQRLVGK